MTIVGEFAVLKFGFTFGKAVDRVFTKYNLADCYAANLRKCLSKILKLLQVNLY